MWGWNCPDWLCFFCRARMSETISAGFMSVDLSGWSFMWRRRREGSLSSCRLVGKRAELCERRLGGISGMGWDWWPGAGLGLGSRAAGGGTQGQAQGLPLRDRGNVAPVFCFLGVGGVWGKNRSSAQKTFSFLAHGAQPLRTEFWPVPCARKRVPGPWFETFCTPEEREAARIWRLVNALAATAVPGGR